MSSIINKIKEAVHDKKHSAPEGTHGPHQSKAANAADPRVDSDRDGSHRIGHTTDGHDTSYTRSDNYMHGSSNTHNTHLGDGPAPHTAGPYRSDAMNKIDPRVDSDRDGSRNLGMSTGPAPYTAGPHKSDAMNKADPRVDSDRDGSRNLGMNRPHEYSGIGSAPEGTYGPHSTRAANAIDPRVDSDRDGSNTYGGTQFNGPAHHTAGPHKSDMMNKMDPRVDSDLDGSNTFGDKTYTQSNAHDRFGQEGKNPLDASQVPPSVLRKHLGNVQIEHDDRTHDRERRHSVATHQEKHVMGGVA